MNIKTSVVFTAVVLLALTACTDHSKKRTFSARTEATAADTSDTAAQDSLAMDDMVNISIELTTMDADSTDGNIEITSNGKLYKSIDAKAGENPVELELNNYYLIKCSKNGFITKTVSFDTHVPEGREKEEFAEFKMTVELHKEKKGEKTDTVKPVGGIKYSATTGDFEKVSTPTL